MDGRAWWAAVRGVARSRTRLRDFTLFFHFHALEKEMATHSSVLVWRTPGTGEPGGLPSMGSHRVGHDWSDLAAAAAKSEGNCWLDERKSSRLVKMVSANICSLGRRILSSLFSRPHTWHLFDGSPGSSMASQSNRVNSPSQPLELPPLNILTLLDDNVVSSCWG